MSFIETSTNHDIQTTFDIGSQLSLVFVPNTCPTSTQIGSNCNISSFSCDILQPCQNSGTCINDNNTVNGYICSCSIDVNGTQCQYNYQLCQINTCWNNGKLNKYIYIYM